MLPGVPRTCLLPRCGGGQEELLDGEDVATCPSCSLLVKVIYDLVSECADVWCVSICSPDHLLACAAACLPAICASG